MAHLFRLAVLLAAWPVAAVAQDGMPRLPRETFDVIAPSDRVRGEPGTMSVWQSACRVGPTAWARRRIVDIAVQEWAFFGFQTVDAANVETRLLPPGLVPETLNPLLPAPRIVRRYPRIGTFEDAPEVAATIAGYWSATPDGPGVLAGRNRAWLGSRGREIGWVQPWSAAFISWVMCEAGLGDPSQFARDAAHRSYVDQAIAARDGDSPGAAYIAYDAGEAPIEPGDLLCNARESAAYRSLADRRRDQGRYASTHCDIVVAADDIAPRLLVIGGNVMESVALTILPGTRDGGGHMRPVDETMIDGARTVFAHLRLQASSIEPDALNNSPAIRALTRQP